MTRPGSTDAATSEGVAEDDPEQVVRDAEQEGGLRDEPHRGRDRDPEDIGVEHDDDEGAGTASSSAVSEPEEAAADAAHEGEHRLDRSLVDMLATGAVGGIDVSIGVLALVLVLERTGNEIVASLAFAIGFVALSLAGSELITENFLVPVTTVAKGLRTYGSLVRLWSGTLVANLLGGLVVVWLFSAGWPEQIGAAVAVGTRSVEQGIGLASFARAMVAGLLITLMTWMQVGVSNSIGGRVVAAFTMGFLIIYTHSNHVVVGFFEMALGMLAGADITWWDMLVRIPWFLLGNMVGGLGFVTLLRLVQVRGRSERFDPVLPE